MTKKPCKIFAISGEKNSGKTTLIEAVIPILEKKGIRTAVIKHDGHSFSPDVPGTDTQRFFESGALGVAVYDSEKLMVTKRASVNETDIFHMFPEADLIIIEGLKNSDYPKLMLKAGRWMEPEQAASMLEAYVKEEPHD